MNYTYSVHSIVMEASSKEDQKYMKTMSKSDVHQVNGALVQNLYGAVINMKNIDFGDIPDSGGDIEKVKYYPPTVESLEILTELCRKNMIDEPALGTVKTAISNMKLFKPQFMNGFKVKHEFIMLTYNSMVMAIIDATTSLISNYMNYIVSSEQEYTLRHTSNKERGSVALSTLTNFNSACDKGQMAQCLSFMVKEQKSAFMGADDVMVTGAIIMALLSIVPFIRECIYFYYHSRVKISDYLELQADFLEMNKTVVNSSAKTPQEKKAIVKKQEALIKKMRKNADKIAISNADVNDVAKKQIKDENSIWSLSNIEKKLTNDKLADNSITIF